METVELGESFTENKPKTKFKGGRPKAEAAARIHKLFNVYGTIVEGDLIKEKFKLHAYGRNLSLSDFIKSRVIPENDAKDKGSLKRINSEKELDVLCQLRIDIGIITSSLKSLSANYNQSTKRINSMPVSKSMEDELKHQSNTIEESRQVLSKASDLLDELNLILYKRDSSKKRGVN